MVGFIHAVGSLLPYHLLSYGALLGTEVYQVSDRPLSWRGSLSLSQSISLKKFTYSPASCPELCQHQALLSSTPDARIPCATEATLPSVLQMPGWLGCPDSCHTSTI
jgi:hypothetical protein